MKPGIFVAALIVLCPILSSAQLKGLMNKVKSKVEQRLDNKENQQIDKTLDEIEGKNTNDVAANNKPTPAATDANKPAETGLKSFSRYDFVPGDSILYYANFEQESVAELPLGWNTSGSGEVVTLDKFAGKWLRLHKPIIYLTNNAKEFGENYTVEFDLLLQLKSNGWMYPEFNLGLFATKDEPSTSNNFLKEDYKKYAAINATITPGEYKTSRIRVTSFLENKSYFSSDVKAIPTLEQYFAPTPIHVALQVQKERIRIWVNEEKAFDVPRGVPTGYIMNQLKFEVGFTNYSEEQYGAYVGNIKIATGKPDTRHKLLDTGRFSTTGILFDFQSAVIKPESYAVIKEIAGVLSENPTVKIKVIGHTSSDGDDKANMELSKKRAASVKDALVTEFSIDASRIETEGKGETEPIADNKTPEGKAANRRVEFIKN